jgi:hypothetical protein
MRSAIAAAAVAAISVAALPVASLAADPKPVVELFTSQGCSSCPPADALLVELAQRGQVIALSMHVDYWNYIGWADPYSDAGASERQRAYKHVLRKPYVYTPQMVIDGQAEAVGSERAAVAKRIAQARALPHITLAVERKNGAVQVRIPAGQTPAAGADVWVIDYDSRHVTRIERGENSGVTLTNANVVRRMTRVATYKGDALDIPIDLAKMREARRGGCVVLVQAADGGKIYGAVAVTLDPSS